MVLAMTLMTRELNLLYLNWQIRMLKNYVTLSATDFTKTDKVVISKKASQTPIVTPPVCEVNVIITDKWGRQTTETVYVKVLK